jgi:hypothetical protein
MMMMVMQIHFVLLTQLKYFYIFLKKIVIDLLLSAGQYASYYIITKQLFLKISFYIITSININLK